MESADLSADLSSDPSVPRSFPDDFAEHLVLWQLIERAARKNPGVQAAWARSDAAGERRPQVTALPDPQLRLGWYAEPVHTAAGTQEFSVGIGQAIPGFGKRASAGRRADLTSEMARLSAEIRVRDVTVEVVRVFHELVYLRGALAVSVGVEEQALRLVQLAAGPAAGLRRTGLGEQVRAESFLAQLVYDRTALEELQLVEEERLRALLDLPAGTPLGPPRGLSLPAVDLGLAALRERALSSNQELRLDQVAVERAREAIVGARLERRPDLYLGGRWIQTDGLSNSPLVENGEDAVFFELGISLPVWEGANRARVREAEHGLRAAVLAREERASRVRADLARQWWRATNTARLAELYRETLLPQAERAARAAEGLFESGDSSFAGLLETVVAWQHYRLATLRADADYGQALAELERLLGHPLEWQPVSGTPVSGTQLSGTQLSGTEEQR